MLKELLIFIGGAAIGSVATYFITKNKNEQYIQSEIEQFKKDYITPVLEKPKEKLFEYKFSLKNDDIGEGLVYADPEVHTPVTLKDEPSMHPSPTEDIYPITEDEFNTFGNGFEQDTLTYWSDENLTDDMDNVVCAAETVGEHFWEYFGKGDDPDTIYIRNTVLMKDYIVTRDSRRLQDILGG